MKNLKLLINMVIFCSLLTIPQTLNAQDGFDGPGEDNVPIDGGISLLVGAAALYGAKKLKDRRQH